MMYQEAVVVYLIYNYKTCWENLITTVGHFVQDVLTVRISLLTNSVPPE